MGYTNVFGAAPIQPADVGYNSFDLSAATALVWPSLSNTDTDVIMAKILAINCTVAANLSLPIATTVSVGESVLITNSGSATISVVDYGGGAVTTVIAGAAKYIYLTDNSTEAGAWTSLGFGVGTASVDASALAGYGLLAVSNTLNQSCPVTTISTNTAITVADRGRLNVDTTGITFTLPSAATIGNNFFTFIRNGSSGSTTVTPSGGDLIDTAASVTLNPSESIMLVSSGTAWYTVGWGRSVDFNYSQLTKNVAGGSNVTLTSAEAGYKILKFTGLLTANINVVVPTTVTVWYIDNSTTGAYTVTVKTSAGSGIATSGGSRYILYGDGTNVVNAVTTTGSFSSFTAGSASAPSITFAADTDTGLYNTAANQVGVACGGSQVANFVSGGLNVTGAMAATGAVSGTAGTFSGAISGASASFTSALPVASGGTAIASYAVGDILYASGATTLAKLADVATGNALISGGVGVAPSWGKIGLTTHVSGTLALGNGGTGGTSAATARSSLGAAASGSNGDITALTGITGNITATTGKFQADFANATLASRFAFQPSVSNNNMVFNIQPNGTGTNATFYAANDSLLSDAHSFLSMGILSTTEARIESGMANAGTYAPMTFWTSGAERVRITTTGNFNINNAGTGNAQLNVTSSSAKNAGEFRNFDDAGRGIALINSSGSTAGTITWNASTTTYATSSDYRLKDNITSLTGSGAFIDALLPRKWTWKANGEVGTGFIAHEFALVSPSSVTGEKDAVDEDGKFIYQAMQASSAEVMAHIIAEIQSLRVRIAALENA